jgi:Putative MetA-pathway of phenol degradation
MNFLRPAMGLTFLVRALTASVVPSVAAECTPTSAAIETDRPDTTNSSVVVPVGSFQSESGLNLSRRDGTQLFDLTNTRLRLGIAPCLEVLVDVPTYVTALHQPGATGFTNVAPAVKWQMSPIPGKFDLSVVTGIGLPTGTVTIAGHGAQPYLQFPWSVELAEGWAITGMVTNFFMPSERANRYTNQSTFVVERQFGERSFLFAEYIGEFPWAGRQSHLFNAGGGYRITKTQQIDVHVGVGLNRNAPDYILGVGYSFRLDGIFAMCSNCESQLAEKRER